MSSVGKTKSKVEVAPFYNEYRGLFGIDLNAEREEHRAWLEAKGAVTKCIVKKELNEVRLRVSNNSAIKGALYPPIGPPRIPTREKVLHREGSVILKESPRARTTESHKNLLHPSVPQAGVRVTKSGGRGDAIKVAFGAKPGIASSVTKLAKVNESESLREGKEENETSSSIFNELESTNGSYLDDSNNNNDLQTDSLIENRSVKSGRSEKKVPASPIKPKPPTSRAPKTNTVSRGNNRGIRAGDSNKPNNIEKNKDVKLAPVVTVANSEKSKGNNISTGNSNGNSTSNKAKPATQIIAIEKKQNAVSSRPNPRKVNTTTKNTPTTSTQINNKGNGSIPIANTQISDIQTTGNPEVVELDANNISTVEEKEEEEEDTEYYEDASFEEEAVPLGVPSILPPEPSQTSTSYSFDDADVEEDQTKLEKPVLDDTNNTDLKRKKELEAVEEEAENVENEQGKSTIIDLEENGYDETDFEDDQEEQSLIKSTESINSNTPMISNETTTTKINDNKDNNKKEGTKEEKEDNTKTTTTNTKSLTQHPNHRKSSVELEKLSDGSNNIDMKHNREMKNKLNGKEDEDEDEAYEEDYENDLDFNT